MQRATITIHLPTHRREALRAYPDRTVTPAQGYDGNIARYVEFLRDQGRERGFEIRTDQRDVDPVFTIDESGHEQKKQAHDWLAAVPDFWEWLT